MPECAFCSHDGKMSAEHITSLWMRDLFPGWKTISYAKHGEPPAREYSIKKLDWKAKVVCESCNNTWMSKIESQHAKPVLTPLITGSLDISISPSDARSIALFAFKTAVVLDHAYSRGANPFFERSARHEFRDKGTIPPTVRMWLCAYAGNRHSGRFVPLHLKGQLPLVDHVEMYICTFALGHIAIQVVAGRISGDVDLTPTPSFEDLAVPFWPELYPGYVWPGNRALLNRDEFMSFANRWKSLKATIYH